MNKTIIICLWILFLCTNILQAKIYNVKDFGAVGDGQHIDSEAINQAIVQAAREGGGTIYIPAGEYACYSIRLANQIHLYLEQGATVVAAFPTAEKGYDKAEPNPHNSFQESMEAVFGRNCSYIQAERLIVVRTNQHFFSPITDKIALK